MASKRFRKGSEEFDMFGDYYNLVQKYYYAEDDDNDDWWQETVDAINAFAKKYKSIPLSVYLASALLDNLAKQNIGEK